MFKKAFLIFLIIISSIQIFSQNVRLFGIAPSYKNENISLYTYSDLISKTKKELYNFNIDSTGKFDFSIKINTTSQLFFDVGIFHCVFFAQPMDTIFLNLPKRIQKQLKDKMSPFFEPVEFYVGMNDTTDLNVEIKKFDDIYDEFMTKNFFNIYKKPNKKEIESFIHCTEDVFINSPNSYFFNYRKYKYARLKNASYIMDYRRIALDYFHNKPILYNNVAYMQLFNNVFENFFAIYSTTEQGESLIKDIEISKSITDIKQTLSKRVEFSNDTLQELIILKGIHDSFFIRNIIQYHTFSKVQLFHLLDSIEINSKINHHKLIAQNIKQKAKYLSTGSDAPDFNLKKNDKTVSLKNFEGEYIYLNFCNTNSSECREEFELLKRLKKQFKNLKIISISTDDNFSLAQDFFKKMKYKWTLLDYSNDPKILEKYKVEIYPTYCLIDQEQKIMMYPAYSPKDNLELYLFKAFNKQTKPTINEYDDLFKQPSPLKN